MRVDAMPRSQYSLATGGGGGGEVETTSCDVPADATTAVVGGLVEKTDYVLTLRAVTVAYFDMLPDGHAVKRARRLPADRLPTDDAWLPAATVGFTTAGTDRAADVRAVGATPDSVSIAWTPPRTYGSDQLQATVVRWVSPLSLSLSQSRSQLLLSLPGPTVAHV